MENWVRNKLSSCLNYEVPEDLVEFILKIKEEHEIDQITHFLDSNNEKQVVFLSELKQKLFPKSLAIINSQAKPLIPKNNKSNKKYEKKQKYGQPPQEQPEEVVNTGAKKKNKFYNFYGQDGQTNDVVLLKGRHCCECQASKHKLINNCLKCGRIVCEQEGSGPCLFCGNLVCSEEESLLINTNTKKGDNLKKTLLEHGKPKGWEQAILQRDRLLEYDRQSERRTTVIDDESDYFKANSVWLSDAEKRKLGKLEKQLQEQKHASRLNRKMTFDFAGRQIVEEESLTKELEEQILRQVLESVEKSDFSDVHPDLEYENPVFDESNITQFPCLKKSKGGFDGVFSKVQDKEFLEMSDMKNCLSMHQPWASLLVAGIKKHEGRTWYSAHRGKLWIASTAKPVDMDEVKRLEEFYKLHYKNKELSFPSQYPSAVLLGCVLIKDCLPQEEYRKIYPSGESDSPFVFVCEHPEELPIKFPIKGEHKIYKLDSNIHTAAIKAIQRTRHPVEE